MGLSTAVAALLLAALSACRAARLLSGQTVCRLGTQRPCYKIVYFHDASRRVNFEEAQQACRRDAGHLLSIESEAEQRLIEKLIQNLAASDGDFWLGLRRREEEPENTTDCQSLYSWVDGKKPAFWNWYVDEPSCGSEVCVVMYHQPSANEGVGGPYMFQWNDDRCNMKNNFICKYSLENEKAAPTERVPLRPKKPEETLKEETNKTVTSGKDADKVPPKSRNPGGTLKEDTNDTVKEAKESTLNISYILIPAIPLLLLLMVTTGVLCFWLAEKRRRTRTETGVKEHNFWMSPHRTNSPNLEVYNVIKKQNEADLAGTRPDIRNTSFRATSGDLSPPDDLSGDYDNMAGNASESGFVTLASTESGFVTNELYELCSDRVGRSVESAWVENEIYGY
ncbi:layilin isoform X2 [Ambystoma mexicanum]|uniref:layilin isoform X2 n=1 Tax=Ambystoma mexicanum TaxID=8296 RepID=UPI0037E76989